MLTVISYLALFFLSIFGYSCGTILGSKNTSTEPDTTDLALVFIIIVAAFSGSALSDINRWFLVIIALIIGICIGVLRSTVIHRINPQKNDNSLLPIEKSTNPWKWWLGISSRAGGFQTRLILSYLYLVLMVFIAIPMHIFTDPLEIRSRTKKSFWHKRLVREEHTQAENQY